MNVSDIAEGPRPGEAESSPPRCQKKGKPTESIGKYMPLREEERRSNVRHQTTQRKHLTPNRPRRVNQAVVQGVATAIPRDTPQGALHHSDIPGIVRFDSDQEVGHEGVALQRVGAGAVEVPLVQWLALKQIE